MNWRERWGDRGRRWCVSSSSTPRRWICRAGVVGAERGRTTAGRGGRRLRGEATVGLAHRRSRPCPSGACARPIAGVGRPWTLRRRRCQARRTTVHAHGRGARAGRQRPASHQDAVIRTTITDERRRLGGYGRTEGLCVTGSSAVSVARCTLGRGSGPRLFSSWSGVNSRSPTVDISALRSDKRLP
jgi:hypothetical protein